MTWFVDRGDNASIFLFEFLFFQVSLLVGINNGGRDQLRKGRETG